MSKREIIAVTTLAAHLAQRMTNEPPGYFVDHCSPKPEQCAADAMRLQRLGRSARNNDLRCQRGTVKLQAIEQQDRRIQENARRILEPYGLSPRLEANAAPKPCLYIMGLPSNQPESTAEGFGI